MIDMGYIHGIERTRDILREFLAKKNTEAGAVYASLQKYRDKKWSEMNEAERADFNSLSREHHALCEQVNLMYDIVSRLRDEITAIELSESEAV